MANLDTNFLARPDFFVSTGENGQTITLTLYPKLQSVGGFQEEAWNLIGWQPLFFCDTNPIVLMLTTASAVASGSVYGTPKSVTPAVIDIFTENSYIADFTNFDPTTINALFSTFTFKDFICKNPIHISKINLRTQNENVLPQQIAVTTPNIFTGQSDRQLIDVASKKTAYQYQNGIITLDNVDLFVGRNSSIVFNGAMQVSNGDQPENVLPENELYIDITIDKYLSLEKALVENLKLM